MRLLIKYVYNTGLKYGEFPIDSSGNAVSNMDVYVMIEKKGFQKAEEYEKYLLTGLDIRVYLLGRHEITEKELPSSDEIASRIGKLIEAGIGCGEPREVRAMGRIRRDPKFLAEWKPKGNQCLPFIVADIETFILNNVHVPYVAGLLVVNPGDDVAAMENDIYTDFREETHLRIPAFEERSTKMLAKEILVELKFQSIAAALDKFFVSATSIEPERLRELCFLDVL
ncbi:hypothetical protein LUZ61_022881 [Rhynchospora tenuis]|uniref:Uncharacterized protein n=1 Tax=Rhynchospora tenuis TaxID=198213 RepID=A0AAD5W3Y6_9POAL|nr:hypothetical protein LUZ61_022881 [Rhynchospora tenuis]